MSMMIEDLKGKVTVKQFRKNGWLPAGHDGEFRYTHCFQSLACQVDSRGNYLTGLTEEEERHFEEKMRLEEGSLSRYNKDYWASFRIKIGKDGKTLDLSIPSEAVEYKVLCAHSLVANSEAEKIDAPLAEYVLTSIEQEAKVASAITKTKKEAYKLFDKMNYSKMKAYLKVVGNRVSEDTPSEMLESEIGKVIEEDPASFINILKDPHFDMKVFIDDCKSIGAIVKSGSKYSLKGGDIIGYDIDETISYLSKDENQEVYIALKSKLDVKEKA